MNLHRSTVRATRRLLRALASLGVLGLVAVGAPAALVTIARSRFGGAAPWSGWAITGLPDLEDVTGVLAEPLDTTSLVDLVLRATLLLGWGAVAVVVVSTVVETVDRLRHRDAVAPAAAAPRLGRVGGPGRWIAAGLLALLPMVATVRAPVRPALAEFGVGAPRAAAVVDVVVDAAVPPVGGVALVGHPAAARVHTVVPGDTLSGIAAAHLDDASRWPEIWTDNRDRLMPDGRIFSDPNLILPGWPLVVDVDDDGGQPVGDAETGTSVDGGDSHRRDDATVSDTGHSPAATPPTPERSAATGGSSSTDSLGSSATGVLTTAAPGSPVLGATTSAAPATGAATAPTTAPAVAAVDPLGDPSSPVGLGHAAMISTGVLALVAARRRQRLRRAGRHTVIPRPGAISAQTERLLRSLGDGERLVRADVAVRAAASAVADAGARVVAVLVEPGGAVELRLQGEAPVHAPFTTPAGAPVGDRWLLPAAVPVELVAPRARLVSMPCVAMVELGRTPDGRDVIVDLEALGVLAIVGPTAPSAAVVRALALTLATSPFAEVAHLVAVDVPAEAFAEHRQHHRCPDLATATALVTDLVGTTARQGTSTFELRTRHTAGESWEPAVLLVGEEAIDHTAPLPVGAGTAVVLAGEHPAASARLRRDGPVWCLEPLGIELVPIGVGDDDLAAISMLLAEATKVIDPVDGGGRVELGRPEVADDGCDPSGSVHTEEGCAAEPSPGSVPGVGSGGVTVRVPGDLFVDVSDDRPEWSLMIRLFGPVDVVDCEGRCAAIDRSKTRELLAWLGTHRERSTRSAARTALWELDVRDATFSNVVSEARRAMARLVPPPEGEEWLGRTLTEALPLHPGVVTDADILEHSLDLARRQAPDAAVRTLTEAVELIRGAPFEGTAYLWPDAEGISSRLVLLATSVAAELAEHHLARGDVDAVFRATDRGLRVLPGHEGLIALRMRARAGAGDHAGLRHEWAAYERVVTADPWGDGEPARELTELRHELLRTR
jgi:DNA-binding SARP family transcriptional activator